LPTGSAFIHYGLGNLFFDQMDSIATRQMFADRLIFYGGRHISAVLFTGLIEDFSRHAQ
jgi:poly-gamma-glutamate synthesis protein (capsule biosynthesis protein)